jgi:hypothetical protein
MVESSGLINVSLNVLYTPPLPAAEANPASPSVVAVACDTCSPLQRRRRQPDEQLCFGMRTLSVQSLDSFFITDFAKDGVMQARQLVSELRIDPALKQCTTRFYPVLLLAKEDARLMALHVQVCRFLELACVDYSATACVFANYDIEVHAKLAKIPSCSRFIQNKLSALFGSHHVAKALGAPTVDGTSTTF